MQQLLAATFGLNEQAVVGVGTCLQRLHLTSCPLFARDIQL